MDAAISKQHVNIILMVSKKGNYALTNIYFSTVHCQSKIHLVRAVLEQLIRIVISVM